MYMKIRKWLLQDAGATRYTTLTESPAGSLHAPGPDQLNKGIWDPKHRVTNIKVVNLKSLTHTTRSSKAPSDCLIWPLYSF